MNMEILPTKLLACYFNWPLGTIEQKQVAPSTNKRKITTNSIYLDIHMLKIYISTYIYIISLKPTNT